MIKKPIRSIPYYTKYQTQKINDNEYKIIITYFMYAGDTLSDINAKKTKTIFCSAEQLKDKEIYLHNRIAKTYSLLHAALRRLGANQTAAISIIKEKMK